MTARTGNDKTRHWAIMAVVATVVGLIWIASKNGFLLVEQRDATAALSPADRPEKSREREPGDEMASRQPHPVSQEERLERLLEIVERSDVVFIRNGSEYNGAQAATHLREKLQTSGLQQPTLDEFIENIASRSSVSGRAYQVRLADGTTVDAGLWLRLQCDKTSVSAEKTPSKEGQ